jgi:hypothetical protein|uniref:Uncharacterized protein n=1 Tax=Micromonas commoda virus TaxID=3057169 RepID=A0AAU7YNR9_9PHYC
MQSIVMDTSPLQGWTTSNYKSFKAVDESSESGSDSDSDSESEAPRKGNIRGYNKDTYKKILVVEELLPE